MRIKTINKRRKKIRDKAIYCDGSCKQITSPGRCYPQTLWNDIKGSPNYGKCWRCGKKLREVFLKVNGNRKFIGYI